MMQQQKLEKLKQDQQAGRTFLGKAKKKAVVKSSAGAAASSDGFASSAGGKKKGGRSSVIGRMFGGRQTVADRDSAHHTELSP